MDSTHLITHVWYPLRLLGVTSPWSAVTSHTVINTWITLAILAAFALAGRVALRARNSRIAFAALLYVRNFENAARQACEEAFSYRYVTFITTLFTFLLICNCLVLIPGLEEPTTDISTTLAFALIAFCYIQREAIRAHGIKAYILEYMAMPFTLFPTDRAWTLRDTLLLPLKVISNCITGLATLPLEMMGKFSTIISLALRLFGNIVAGSSIIGGWNAIKAGSLWINLAGTLLQLNLLLLIFFGFFEGLIQAFVFSTLTITYLGMAIQHEEQHD